MDVKLTDEALEDREELSEEEWDIIRSKIKEATDSLTHKDLKLVPNPFLDHSVWQLTVEEDETDHRVYIDVKDGKAVVLAIWSFEFTHNGDQHWTQLEERM